MQKTFSEVKLFQVKPNKLNEFEELIIKIQGEQKRQKGCLDMKYMKRFFVFDSITEPPRVLTKIIKCVKYYSYWEFDSIEDYSFAANWFFSTYEKELMKLLIVPFDISCGETI